MKRKIAAVLAALSLMTVSFSAVASADFPASILAISASFSSQPVKKSVKNILEPVESPLSSTGSSTGK